MALNETLNTLYVYDILHYTIVNENGESEREIATNLKLSYFTPIFTRRFSNRGSPCKGLKGGSTFSQYISTS